MASLVLIGIQGIVGSASLLARMGLGAGMSALGLSAWRLAAAAAVLLFAGLLARRKAGPAEPPSRAVQARLVLAGVCLGLHFAAWFASLQHIPVACSTLLVSTSPVFAALGGMLLLRQRLPGAFWAGLALAAAGVWLVVAGAGPAPIRGSALAGDALATAGALMIAAYFLLVQELQARLGTWRTVTWTYSAAAVALWAILLLAGRGAGAMPAGGQAWLSILAMAAGPQLLGHTGLNWSLKRFPAGVVAASTLLEPVFAGALAWVFLGEPLSAQQAAGGAVLLAGVGLCIRR